MVLTTKCIRCFESYKFFLQQRLQALFSTQENRFPCLAVSGPKQYRKRMPSWAVGDKPIQEKPQFAFFSPKYRLIHDLSSHLHYSFFPSTLFPLCFVFVFSLFSFPALLLHLLNHWNTYMTFNDRVKTFLLK